MEAGAQVTRACAAPTPTFISGNATVCGGQPGVGQVKAHRIPKVIASTATESR